MRSAIAAAAVILALPFAARADNPDGRYSGALNYQVNNNSAHAHCHNGTGILRVHADTVTAGTPDGPQTAPLAADGSFTIRAGSRVIEGKVAGGTVSGLWTNGSCTAHYEMHKGE